MSILTCQHIQRRLLEPEAGRLTVAEHDHLSACPACRVFAQDVQLPGAVVSSVARQIHTQAPVALPPALKQRVQAQIRQEFDREAAANVQRTSAADLDDRTPLWSRLMEALGEGLVRWRWAALTAAVLLVAGAATLQFLQTRPIGKLEFATGPTSLRVASLADQQHVGLGQWTCPRGSTLSTPENAAASFSVGEGVQAAMAQATTLQVLDKQKIALTRGSVWLHVTPGGKGFKVQTPFALVQVTGTRFGVTVTEHETRVEVSEGSVAVTQAQSQGKVTAGEALTAGPGGVTAPQPRAEGTNPPGWVNALHAAEQQARAGSWLPSIGKRQ